MDGKISSSALAQLGAGFMRHIFLTGVLAACVFSGVAQAQIVMGVGGPMTGPDAAFGAQRLKNGVEQAVSDINSGGRNHGPRRSSSASAMTPATPSRAARSPTSSSAKA